MSYNMVLFLILFSLFKINKNKWYSNFQKKKKSNFHIKTNISIQVEMHMKNMGPQNDDSTVDYLKGQAWTQVKGNMTFG